MELRSDQGVKMWEIIYIRCGTKKISGKRKFWQFFCQNSISENRKCREFSISPSTFLSQKRVQSGQNVRKFKNSKNLNKILQNAASTVSIAQKLISPAPFENKTLFDFSKKRENWRKFALWTRFCKSSFSELRWSWKLVRVSEDA